MKELEKDIAIEIISSINKVSEVFHVIKEKGGEEYCLKLHNGANIKVNNNLFALDFSNRLPENNETGFCKWDTITLEIMRVISAVNRKLQEMQVKISSLLEKLDELFFSETALTA